MIIAFCIETMSWCCMKKYVEFEIKVAKSGVSVALSFTHLTLFSPSLSLVPKLRLWLPPTKVVNVCKNFCQCCGTGRYKKC